MLRAVLKKSREHPPPSTKQQLYDHLHLTSQTIWTSQELDQSRSMNNWANEERDLRDSFQSERHDNDYDFFTLINHENSPTPTNQQLYDYLPLISQTIQAGQVGHCWINKDKLIKDVFLRIPTHGHTSVGRSAKIFIHQLCVDIGCCLEDQLRSMNDWVKEERDLRDSDQSERHDDSYNFFSLIKPF